MKKIYLWDMGVLHPQYLLIKTITYINRLVVGFVSGVILLYFSIMFNMLPYFKPITPDEYIPLFVVGFIIGLMYWYDNENDRRE